MKKLLILLFLLPSTILMAQYFETGQDPASIKWRQINTLNFQLIYPDYYEEQAQVLAQKLELVYDFGSSTLGHKPKKISVILHTQTVQSNGLVAYAPKRSELYTTPRQSIYPQDWLEQLALHEFRHVVQIDKMNTELPQIIKIILGEQGTALLFGAYLPWWFIEGDAVVTETALSNYGRGRLPSFLVEHRAQVVDKKRYSYDKAYLGSYKDFVPDHYRLGYYLVANSRERYGAEIWGKAISRAAKKPLSLTPFNKTLKLETGMGKVKLYESIFDSLSVVWKNTDSEFQTMPSKQITPNTKTYTNYQYNYSLNEQEIISYKTSLDAVPAFVIINKNGVEKKLFSPGTIFDESVNYYGDWIVWAEQKPSVRWSHSGTSQIKLFNVRTRKSYSFSPEFKAFAPALTADLEQVAVVETDFSSNNYLSVYNITSGELKHRYQTSENNFFFSPVWLNQHEILCVVLTEAGKRIAKINLQTESHTFLSNTELGDIKQLQISENKLYFISSYSGKDALYQYNLGNGELEQLYAPRFDAAYPTIGKNGEIILSDYTGNGYRIIEVQAQNSLAITDVEKGTWLLADKMQKQEPGIVDFSISDTANYESKAYSKFQNLINFHSWAPLFIEPYDYEFSPGASLMSQNKLGTALTTIGYKWDTSEKTGQFFGKYTYKGWFPVFDLEISKGKRSSQYWLIRQYTQNDEVVRQDTVLQGYKWNETALKANVRIPLNLTRGAYLRMLQPEIQYELTNYGKDHSTPDEFRSGNYNSLSYRLYFYQQLRKSHQDVYPNFGFSAEGYFRHSPWNSEEMGNLRSGAANVYLPGFMCNHGIRIYGGLQEKQRGNAFRFSDVIRFPRGWYKIETENLQTITFDYALPLINPDISIGGLTYVRRISANLFADFANLKGTYHSNNDVPVYFETNISSYGVEVLGDVNFFRFYAPVKIGVRASYLKEIEDVGFDFLLSVDFNSL